jgi:hypothetical protein
MYHKQRFFVYLFDDQFYGALTPHIVKATDVNFVVDFELICKLEVALPIFVLSLLICPHTLKTREPAFFDQLCVHIVDCEA